jgi:hypothetical protein
MIEVRRPVRRVSGAKVYDRSKPRPVVVELSPPGVVIGFRLKGNRRAYYLPIDWCFREAVRVELARAKAERAKARKAARNGRA